MLLRMPTTLTSPAPTAAKCCCIWERPPRTAKDRTRRMVAVDTECPTHKATATLAQVAKASEYKI